VINVPLHKNASSSSSLLLNLSKPSQGNSPSSASFPPLTRSTSLIKPHKLELKRLKFLWIGMVIFLIRLEREFGSLDVSSSAPNKSPYSSIVASNFVDSEAAVVSSIYVACFVAFVASILQHTFG
jgi:hypothetical protein